MIVDTSAICAIVFAESDAAAYASALEASDVTLMSTGSLLEASIVTRDGGEGRLDLFVEHAGITVVPFDVAQTAVARRAYAQFGKGSSSPAQLNFGDCFSYALAKTTGQPLLFKGDDFTHTDVAPALT